MCDSRDQTCGKPTKGDLPSYDSFCAVESFATFRCEAEGVTSKSRHRTPTHSKKGRPWQCGQPVQRRLCQGSIKQTEALGSTATGTDLHPTVAAGNGQSLPRYSANELLLIIDRRAPLGLRAESVLQHGHGHQHMSSDCCELATKLSQSKGSMQPSSLSITLPLPTKAHFLVQSQKPKCTALCARW